MQTVWVLMAECGFIQPPFRVVKSYGKSERRDARAVVPVKIGIETFYKVFRNSRPSHTSTAEERCCGIFLEELVLIRSTKGSSIII